MAKRISFYSFKGGAGRSTGLCNVAYSLADTGANVGIIDFDIEAAGLNFVLGVSQDVLGEKKKLQQYLIDEQRAQIHLNRFEEEMIINFDRLPSQTRPWDSDPDGTVYFLPADQDAELTGDVKEAENLMDVINDLYATFEEECDLDYLLLDSRSGISNFAMPTLGYADEIAVFFRWSSQHREGTVKLVDWLDTYLAAFGDVDIFAVPSSVPLGAKVTNPEGIEETISREDIDGWIERNLAEKVRGHQIIPESDLLKVYEQLITPTAHPETNTPTARGYKELADDLR